MSTEARRSIRYEEFLAVSVLVGDYAAKGETAVQHSGRLINISRHGACLIIPGRVDSVPDETNRVGGQVTIQGSLNPEIPYFSLDGQAVWTTSFTIDNIQALKIGVEFLSEEASRMSANIIKYITKESANNIKTTATP